MTSGMLLEESSIGVVLILLGIQIYQIKRLEGALGDLHIHVAKQVYQDDVLGSVHLYDLHTKHGKYQAPSIVLVF